LNETKYERIGQAVFSENEFYKFYKLVALLHVFLQNCKVYKPVQHRLCVANSSINGNVQF